MEFANDEFVISSIIMVLIAFITGESPVMNAIGEAHGKTFAEVELCEQLQAKQCTQSCSKNQPIAVIRKHQCLQNLTLAKRELFSRCLRQGGFSADSGCVTSRLSKPVPGYNATKPISRLSPSKSSKRHHKPHHRRQGRSGTATSSGSRASFLGSGRSKKKSPRAIESFHKCMSLCLQDCTQGCDEPSGAVKNLFRRCRKDQRSNALTNLETSQNCRLNDGW